LQKYLNEAQVTKNDQESKGLITEDEFMEKLKAERAAYLAMFQKGR